MVDVKGTPVKVLVRNAEKVSVLSHLPGVTIEIGDALDEAAVQKCMSGCIAAITTLGGQPADGTGQRVDYAGNSNVIEQAGILGVERIILLTRFEPYAKSILMLLLVCLSWHCDCMC